MFLRPLSTYSTTLHLACIHHMLVLRQLGQQKVSQEFAVSWGLVNGFREEPSTCCCSSVFRPYGHDKMLRALALRQLWLSLRTGYIFRPAHLRLRLLAFHIFLRQNRTTRPTQQGELCKQNSSCRTRNSLIFRYWCKHQTLWRKGSKLK